MASSTIRFIGSGPLTGRVFYGAVIGVLAQRPGQAFVDLDEEYAPYEKSVNIDIETGYMYVAGGTTDLLRVDPQDRELFRDASYRAWKLSNSPTHTWPL